MFRNALRDLDAALSLDLGSVQTRLQRCALRGACRGLDTRAAAAQKALGTQLFGANAQLAGGLVARARGRMLAQTCSFAHARADLEAVLAARPGHRSASQELAKVGRAEAALQAARDSRRADSTAPGHCGSAAGWSTLLALTCAAAVVVDNAPSALPPAACKSLLFMLCCCTPYASQSMACGWAAEGLAGGAPYPPKPAVAHGCRVMQCLSAAQRHP